jgi:hypothetical protein
MTTYDDARPVRRRKRRKGSMLMAWGMLLVAAAVFGLFIYQASGFGEDETSFAKTPQGAAPEAGGSGKADANASKERFALAESEVAGFDDEKQPYTISADAARQDKKQPNLVYMDQVNGILRRTDGRKMDVTAHTGKFDSKEKSLLLDGNVTIVLEDTFTANMATAQVDVQKKSLASDADVLVKLDTGQIFSTGIDVYDNGAHVVFRSRVKAIFEDGAQSQNAEPASAQAITSTGKGNLQQ